MIGFVNCFHRLDGQTTLPTKGSCSSLDVNWNKTSMPATGAFTALPGGSYLTGYNVGVYSGNKLSTYYYCGAGISSGAIGNAFNLGAIGGVAYPQLFNVFAFGNIVGLSDVEGPAAAGGAVGLKSFNLNWGLQQSVALVSAGNLTLASGAVHGSIYYGATESINTNVTYNSAQLFQSQPIQFATAQTELQAASQSIAAFSGNGKVVISNGNVTLTGIDPNINFFSLAAPDLLNVYSITINAPSNSTVIINVSGPSVKIVDLGITNYITVSKLLWNFSEATSLYISSVGLPGSVLAPSANASLGGNINGTLIAQTVNSTNEFHYAPFQHNWLVP